jgi:quercetin dioxygenase-like cupin family protein
MNLIKKTKMKYIFKFSLMFLTILLVACINKQNDTTMKDNPKPVFPKGDKITNNNNFTGMVWLQMLVNNDSIYNTSIGNVTFEPKARTNWHKHPGGQILLITAGLGYYQEKGKPAIVLHKGDVVKIPPDAVHWHGASPNAELTHIAISPNTSKGSVVWLQPVTDEEYNQSRE